MTIHGAGACWVTPFGACLGNGMCPGPWKKSQRNGAFLGSIFKRAFAKQTLCKLNGLAQPAPSDAGNPWFGVSAVSSQPSNSKVAAQGQGLPCPPAWPGKDEE